MIDRGPAAVAMRTIRHPLFFKQATYLTLRQPQVVRDRFGVPVLWLELVLLPVEQGCLRSAEDKCDLGLPLPSPPSFPIDLRPNPLISHHRSCNTAAAPCQWVLGRADRQSVQAPSNAR